MPFSGSSWQLSALDGWREGLLDDTLFLVDQAEILLLEVVPELLAVFRMHLRKSWRR